MAGRLSQVASRMMAGNGIVCRSTSVSIRLRSELGLPVGKHSVPDKPLPVNDELVWDNGTAFPEPCIDRMADTVGKFEALTWHCRMTRLQKFHSFRTLQQPIRFSLRKYAREGQSYLLKLHLPPPTIDLTKSPEQGDKNDNPIILDGVAEENHNVARYLFVTIPPSSCLTKDHNTNAWIADFFM